MAKNSVTDKDGMDEGSLLNQLQAVARQTRTHIARHLLDTGIYAGQEQIINLLATHKSLSSGEIARALGVRPPTITKSIARLQEQGFVERTKGHEDGRIVRVTLTKAGKKSLTKVSKATKKAEKQVLGKLTSRRQKQLRKALNSMAENLSAREKKVQKKA
ncbi:MAG: MarR family transcriptional regulator [Pseudomonadota bacterium]